MNLDVTSQDGELFNLVLNLINVIYLDWLLATWAAHEGKSDPQGGPLVLQQLKYTISMVDMAACEFDAGLLTQLTCVANRAEFLLRRQIAFSSGNTVRLKTG